MQNDGTNLQNLIAKWLKNSGVLHERFFDSRSVGGLATSRPADFLAYKKPLLYYLECKDCQASQRLDFNRLTQMKKLYEAAEKYEVKAYFIVRIGAIIMALNALSFMPIVIEAIRKNKHSFNLIELKKFGYEISQSNFLEKLL